MSFENHYYKTAILEGGYANHENDKGGETYKGIARKFWADWNGWSIIDSIKTLDPGSFKTRLNGNTQLQSLVMDFYKKNFWDNYLFGQINSDLIAGELYDTCVNMGSRPIKWLQENINIFRIIDNKVKIEEDGKMGNGTILALNEIIANKTNEQIIYKALDSDQANYYKKIVKDDQTQAIFYVGWMKNRVR